MFFGKPVDIDQLTSYLSTYFSDVYDHSMCYGSLVPRLPSLGTRLVVAG